MLVVVVKCLASSPKLVQDCLKLTLFTSSQLGAPLAVYEIKGALSAWRTNFPGRAHIFRTCAPNGCTIFHSKEKFPAHCFGVLSLVSLACRVPKVDI